MASFTTRKRTVDVVKTGHLRQYTVSVRFVFGLYYSRLPTFFYSAIGFVTIQVKDYDPGRYQIRRVYNVVCIIFP